jgi:hypothetical protein
MRQSLVLAMVGAWICAAAVLSAASADDSYHPKAVHYDSARLAGYSTQDLIDLMSTPSFALNVKPGSGAYATMPPDFDADFPHRVSFTATSTATRMATNFGALSFLPEIGSELVKRHPREQALDVFLRSDDRAQRAWMLDALLNMDDPSVDRVLRRYKTSATDDANYFVNVYFARHCDTAALGNLLANYDAYKLPPLEKAGVALLFGGCQYKPAVPVLLDSLNAMVLNLAEQAQESLGDIYPDAHIVAATGPEAQIAWKDYIKSHP